MIVLSIHEHNDHAPGHTPYHALQQLQLDPARLNQGNQVKGTWEALVTNCKFVLEKLRGGMILLPSDHLETKPLQRCDKYDSVNLVFMLLSTSRNLSNMLSTFVLWK